MYDPLTVAFEIRSPFREKPSRLWPKGYRPPFITIWHKDPERDGTDDSCDWFGRKRPLSPAEQRIAEAIWEGGSIFGNPPHYLGPEDRTRESRWFSELKKASYEWRRRKRRWFQHPRWHIWHWRIQVRPYQSFKRAYFVRCGGCRKRFGKGPAFGFFGGGAIFHEECMPGRHPAAAPAASESPEKEG